jgi:hypothetical protein
MTSLGFILAAAAAFAAVVIAIAAWFARGVEWSTSIAYLLISAGGGAAAAASTAIFAQFGPQFIPWLSLAGAVMAACFGAGFARGIELLRKRKPRVATLLAPVLAIPTAIPAVLMAISMAGLIEKDEDDFRAVMADAGESVYNAMAEPNGGSPEILLNRVPTKIFFNIGPASLRSMISRPKISQLLLKELNQHDSADLAVVMTCYVCKSELPQTRLIRYSEPRQDSTVAEFSILPDIDVAQERKAQSISFSIRRDGNELDFLNVPIRIEPVPPTGAI